MDDAIGDSDDEADFSKMDLGNKKGPVGRLVLILYTLYCIEFAGGILTLLRSMPTIWAARRPCLKLPSSME